MQPTESENELSPSESTASPTNLSDTAGSAGVVHEGDRQSPIPSPTEQELQAIPEALSRQEIIWPPAPRLSFRELPTPDPPSHLDAGPSGHNASNSPATEFNLFLDTSILQGSDDDELLTPLSPLDLVFEQPGIDEDQEEMAENLLGISSCFALIHDVWGMDPARPQRGS